MSVMEPLDLSEAVKQVKSWPLWKQKMAEQILTANPEPEPWSANYSYWPPYSREDK